WDSVVGAEERGERGKAGPPSETKQRDVALGEGLPLLGQAAVKRQRERTAEDVGIRVERRAEDMPDARPVGSVARVEPDRRPHEGSLGAKPQFVHQRGRELPVAPDMVDAPLELMDGGVVKNRVDQMLQLE